ncbi:hypothetical protein EMIHUDRAFT_56200, partial [Emiliania huxleyi CCMP1516]|uniref:Derlin n=2 Tax=Emiliania huxleyi TaxID=2903 RepID=A0A0D3JU92_EMIH1
LEEWYYEMPLVTRVYLTASIVTTGSCALELVSPFSLYFNFNLVVFKFQAATQQVWRLFTNFFFFGSIGLDFLFHMFFLVRYCRLLEEGSFRGRTADFVAMLLFGAHSTLGPRAVDGSAPTTRETLGPLLCACSPFTDVPPFLGSALAFMMVYVWGRRNEHVRMSFLGLFQFRAPYLPWVLLGFS